MFPLSRMIEHFSDHAANERTFLAWLRTGLAVAAFGFVIEKFDLFLTIMAQSADGARALAQGWTGRLFAPIGRYEGVILIALGIGIMILGTVRFARTAREIERAEYRPARHMRLEILLSGLLAFLASGLCLFLVLQ
ncbi:MAG TPA: DUF202 domain-containing protein [Stellaceae bacterium]|nr:DUF202 domain-containing protein [Stellaceae bacterium]